MFDRNAVIRYFAGYKKPNRVIKVDKIVDSEINVRTQLVEYDEHNWVNKLTSLLKDVIIFSKNLNCDRYSWTIYIDFVDGVGDFTVFSIMEGINESLAIVKKTIDSVTSEIHEEVRFINESISHIDKSYIPQEMLKNKLDDAYIKRFDGSKVNRTFVEIYEEVDIEDEVIRIVNNLIDDYNKTGIEFILFLNTKTPSVGYKYDYRCYIEGSKVVIKAIDTEDLM